MVGFGQRAQLQAIGTALAPVGAYVEPWRAPARSQAMFIHLATGGLHPESG